MTLAERDFAVLRAIRGLADDGAPTSVVRAISRAGEYGACWIAIALTGAALDRRRRRRWLRLAASVAATHSACVAVKYLIRRPRPAMEDLPPLIGTEGGMSFPSAHAASSFAAAAGLADLAPGPPWHALAAGMASTRVYLGVHYPTDVVAGAIAGAVAGRLAR